MEWLNAPVPTPNAAATEAARVRQAQLTKPPGSLGELEAVAIRLAGLQGREQPRVDKVHISIFAADHGVADEGVSAFPQAVTVQMVHNFLNGGAAISVLARELGATLEIVDVGVKTPVTHPKLISQRAGDGTANSTLDAAMTSTQLSLALQAGADAAERAATYPQRTVYRRGNGHCQYHRRHRPVLCLAGCRHFGGHWPRHRVGS